MAEPMTRRDRNAEATRRDILAAGREIFSQHSYSEVSGLEICNQAGVTRGALQHHFGSKLGLFMAVFEGLQHDVSLQITQAIDEHQEPWEQARAGIAAFLDACAQPAYQTIVLKEGPAAIGWERWRELDTDYYAHLVRAFIDLLAPTGPGDYASAMLAATMRGTLTELSFEVAQSSDQALARQEALVVVDRLLSSFHATPPISPTPEPIRIGIGQLRAGASEYLDRVAAGETINVIRRGRVVARLQSAS
ncbi:MAG TPA: TetR family transcriptional regulator [Mycobacterium sp.]|jgi:AcrR family transcriptional regulator|nr:TetR family transcriptional regulator [Mycobacterium sp.]